MLSAWNQSRDLQLVRHSHYFCVSKKQLDVRIFWGWIDNRTNVLYCVNENFFTGMHRPSDDLKNESHCRTHPKKR